MKQMNHRSFLRALVCAPIAAPIAMSMKDPRVDLVAANAGARRYATVLAGSIGRDGGLWISEIIAGGTRRGVASAPGLVGGLGISKLSEPTNA